MNAWALRHGHGHRHGHRHHIDQHTPPAINHPCLSISTQSLLLPPARTPPLPPHPYREKRKLSFPSLPISPPQTTPEFTIPVDFYAPKKRMKFSFWTLIRWKGCGGDFERGRKRERERVCRSMVVVKFLGVQSVRGWLVLQDVFLSSRSSKHYISFDFG